MKARKALVRLALRGDVSGTAFRFYPQSIGFELVSDEASAEVLTPNNIYDILDFQLRACVKQEVKMRRCKNCGRYFALTGHRAAEYCGHVADERGRTYRGHQHMDARQEDCKSGNLAREAFFKWPGEQ